MLRRLELYRDNTGGHIDMTESLRVAEGGDQAGTELTLGVEEELHVVDLKTRELVPRAPEVLDQLDDRHYSAELHRSVVETNTLVTGTLDDLRDGIAQLRRRAIGVAESLGLGLVAAGTVPLVDLELLPVTPTSRYRACSTTTSCSSASS
jgi:carboxylate-amine ligase